MLSCPTITPEIPEAIPFRWPILSEGDAPKFSFHLSPPAPVSLPSIQAASPVPTPLALQSADEILNRLDAVVADDDQYQQDEQRPSEATLNLAKQLIQAVEKSGVTEFPRTYVAVYYGEIDITWKTRRDLARLMVKPNGEVELYRQPDYPSSPRGESIPITTADSARIAEQIEWLLRR